jgi:hypothetical protein
MTDRKKILPETRMLRLVADDACLDVKKKLKYVRILNLKI